MDCYDGKQLTPLKIIKRFRRNLGASDFSVLCWFEMVKGVLMDNDGCLVFVVMATNRSFVLKYNIYKSVMVEAYCFQVAPSRFTMRCDRDIQGPDAPKIYICHFDRHELDKKEGPITKKVKKMIENL